MGPAGQGGTKLGPHGTKLGPTGPKHFHNLSLILATPCLPLFDRWGNRGQREAVSCPHSVELPGPEP